jgi:hypothetical protein
MASVDVVARAVGSVERAWGGRGEGARQLEWGKDSPRHHGTGEEVDNGSAAVVLQRRWLSNELRLPASGSITMGSRGEGESGVYLVENRLGAGLTETRRSTAVLASKPTRWWFFGALKRSKGLTGWGECSGCLRGSSSRREEKDMREESGRCLRRSEFAHEGKKRKVEGLDSAARD